MTKKSFLFAAITDILTIGACIPISLFAISSAENAFLNEFFVYGSSMEPTLKGSMMESTYGRCDTTKQAIENAKRFDIIVCYYPFMDEDYAQPYVRNESELLNTASLKVKRLIGLPGDKLIIRDEMFSITDKNGVTTNYGGDYENPPFERKEPIANRVADITLADGEYFVMGDNWTLRGSSDCCNPPKGSEPKPIYRENIKGVVCKLEGIATLADYKKCLNCSKIYSEDKCPACGHDEYDVVQGIADRTPFEDGPIFLL